MLSKNVLILEKVYVLATTKSIAIEPYDWSE
jgi:hypothetical protein